MEDGKPWKGGKTIHGGGAGASIGSLRVHRKQAFPVLESQHIQQRLSDREVSVQKDIEIEH
jgi:hypothetical protein